MAWEWLAPVSTGIVGLGGMMITARVGRSQQRAADSRAWLEYRRAIYAKYLTATDALQHQAVALGYVKAAGDLDKLQAEHLAWSSALRK